MLGFVGKLILLLAMLPVTICVCESSSFADDEFDSAFEASDFPWFDLETGRVAEREAAARPESRVGDRGEIQKAKPSAITPSPTNPAAPAAPANGAGTGTLIGNWLVYILVGILVAGLVGLLVHGFLKRESVLDGGESESSNSKRKIRDHIRHLPFEVEEEDGDFETFADRAFAGGDYSKAVIYLFADVLAGLDEGGLVRLQRGKTNRQYLNEIYDRREISTYYRTVMTAFEDAFFGKHEISKSRAENCLAGRDAFNENMTRINKEKFLAAKNAEVAARNPLSMEPLS